MLPNTHPQWRSLEMSGVERRRLFCAVLFHCAAALCVIWSLCVLIERAAEEVRRGLIGWPFWTKLVVVTVGLTGGVVFMYIQCKQYLNLCNRWRARNRILLIQNAPEKIHPPQSPVMHQFRRVRTAVASAGVNGGNCGSGGGGSSVSNHSVPIGVTVRGFEQQLIGAVGGDHQCESQINQQGHIIAANIENSSINYDRDWTLDDISQVSFKPCIQGSGSLTPMPFHDSAHNICDGSGSGSAVGVASHRYSAISGSSQTVHEEDEKQRSAAYLEQNNGNCSNSIKTADLNLFKVPNAELNSVNNNTEVPSEPNAGRHPNTAIFLENRDILDDPPYHDPSVCPSKLYYRRPTAVGNDSQVHHPKQIDPRHDFRRSSDTKLLQQNHVMLSEKSAGYCPTKDQVLLNPKSIIDDMTNYLGSVITREDEQCSANPQQAQQRYHRHIVTTAGSPSHLFQTTDIQFNSSVGEQPSSRPVSTEDDTLEVNIQVMLELDIGNIRQLLVKKRSDDNISQRTSSLYCQDDPSSPCLGYPDGRPVCSSFSNSRLQQVSAPSHTKIQMPPEYHAVRQPECSSSSTTQFSSNRLKLFKSLPNLSASSENLLPPPKHID
ncbi:uncharacterized protein LOC129764962 isoform X2 [Toxorhynchites rutilus septentrionalis]|uniref:uncharacterized protein LOC129764962 isoform X2 n=1 Tax=Toxorhynchites rutilus septentrionalis TaxID=329112 RepID=UPI002478BF79|nr:uncharacterized protein LOC129764962 isoform X2 [Toxorhynchites rutilus septentrionalis]